ncbi:hypothetical protein [Variovorax sp.]|jgi:hypothetical protein|uniref:hypothetical protein n=1 Tax=Variovorax sp. TaxID=1871043 RepID=UPI0037D9CA8C
MDELDKVLDEYLKTEGTRNRRIAVKALRDYVAPRFVGEGFKVSEVLRGVQRFVSSRVQDGTLTRDRAGVYTYWPEGAPSDLALDADRREIVSAQAQLPVDQQPPGLSVPRAFHSVASLAASNQFLIQTDLRTVDIDELQGLSF